MLLGNQGLCSFTLLYPLFLVHSTWHIVGEWVNNKIF